MPNRSTIADHLAAMREAQASEVTAFADGNVGAQRLHQLEFQAAAFAAIESAAVEIQGLRERVAALEAKERG